MDIGNPHTHLTFSGILRGAAWLLLLAGHGLAADARAAESFAESPFAKPAFSGTPAELLESAIKCDDDLRGADVEILLDESRCCIDATGRATMTTHQIYRCLTRDALDQYGVVQATWTAWHQDRPAMRARVITSDGQVHVLDAQTVEETQIPSGQANVFTDAKLLRAPLPALAVGCVVETEVVITEHQPFSTAGVADIIQLGNLFIPTRHVHIVLEAPASVPLKHRLLKSDAVPDIRQDGDRQVVTVTLGPIPALLDQLESSVPSDLAPIPLFAYSTSPSWQAVAQEYGAIVERQLANHNLVEVARTVLGPGADKGPREVAAALVDFVRQQTRFTAVSFGTARIVPQKPQEVLVRQYGDCKDLATLCVGLLRAAGLQADVVLINTGPGMDILPDLPRLSGFDHAIVLVHGDQPLWVDPTSRFSPVGELPTSDQGRHALVASSTTSDLIRTPCGTASDNLVTAHNVITMLDTTPAQARTILTYHGASAQSVRANFASVDPQQRREWVRQQGVEWFGTDKLVEFTCSEPDDLQTPFQFQTTFEQLTIAGVDHPRAWAFVPLYEPFTWLPVEVTGPPDASQAAAPVDGDASPGQRKLPLALSTPARYEFEYRVVPPPGFVPGKLPEEQVLEFSPARLEVTYRTEADHSVTVRLVLDTGDGRFSVEALRESQRQIQLLGQSQGYRAWQATLEFEQTAGKHLAAGQLREAVAAYRELLEKYPDEPFRHAQLAHALISLGLGDLARTHARRAVELGPADAQAWSALATVLAHNEIGEYLAPGFDRAGSVEAHRKTLELTPDDLGTRWTYAGVLEHDEHGLAFTNPEFVDAAITELATAYSEHKDDAVLDNLASALYVRDRADEARKLLEGAAASPTRDLLLLVGIARAESVDACLQRAAELRPVAAQRQPLIEQLVTLLSYFREYRAAEELATKAADSSSQKAACLQLAQSLARLSRYEPEQEPAGDPIGVVRRAMSVALVHGSHSSRLQPFFANVRQMTGDAPDWGLPDWLDTLRKLHVDANFPPDRIADCVTAFDFEATDRGADLWKVRAKHKGISSFAWDATVLRGDQGLQLYRPGDYQSELGRQALHLLASGKEDEARRWLDWAYDQQRQDTKPFAQLFDPFAGSPFSRLWATHKQDQRDVQVAAAALTAYGTDPLDQSLAILEANRADLEPAGQLQVARALAAGYSTVGEHEKAAALAGTMRAQYPSAEKPLVAELYERAQLKDMVALDKLVAECASVKRIPVWGQLARAEAATATGDLAKARELLTALAQQRAGSPAPAMVHTAWLSLFQHPVPDGTADLAANALKDLQPVVDSPDGERAARMAHMAHIVAMIDAGQLQEGVQALRAMPAVDRDGRANRFDKLALACIAEQCGLHEHAQQLLQEIEPEPQRAMNSLYDLAQNRLKRITDASEH